MSRPKLPKGTARTARVRLSVTHQMRILDALDTAKDVAQEQGDIELYDEYVEVYRIIDKLY